MLGKDDLLREWLGLDGSLAPVRLRFDWSVAQFNSLSRVRDRLERHFFGLNLEGVLLCHSPSE